MRIVQSRPSTCDGRPLLRLSSRPTLAGMDGNRTHAGRVIGAPQTVLKTAGLASADGFSRPIQFDLPRRQSAMVQACPSPSACVAVTLAVRAVTNWLA